MNSQHHQNSNCVSSSYAFRRNSLQKLTRVNCGLWISQRIPACQKSAKGFSFIHLSNHPLMRKLAVTVAPYKTLQLCAVTLYDKERLAKRMITRIHIKLCLKSKPQGSIRLRPDTRAASKCIKCSLVRMKKGRLSAVNLKDKGERKCMQPWKWSYTIPKSARFCENNEKNGSREPSFFFKSGQAIPSERISLSVYPSSQNICFMKSSANWCLACSSSRIRSRLIGVFNSTCLCFIVAI